MILDMEVEVKINARHATYWRNKGYNIPAVGGYKVRTQGDVGHVMKVKVSDLPLESNVIVRCRCERCSKEYTTRYGRANRNTKGWCQACVNSVRSTGNSYSKTGTEHHKWNPNKSDFKRYANRVRALTEKNYREHKDTINPQNLKRGRMGEAGAYQVDHKIPVFYGFQNNIPAEEIAAVENLQMLSWRTNASKASKYIGDNELLLEKL